MCRAYEKEYFTGVSELITETKDTGGRTQHQIQRTSELKHINDPSIRGSSNDTIVPIVDPKLVSTIGEQK